MKKILLGFAVIAIIASCKKESTPPAVNPHVANAPCGSCHTTEQSQWASDLHAKSAIDVLTNVDHNSAELIVDNCIKCHSTFQFPLGVAHFVNPVDQTGQPAGIWTALNTGDWQASKCEVCHDPTATNSKKLAKYGSVLDGTWSVGYTKISELPVAYQTIISSTGATYKDTIYIYPDQTALSAQITKLCSTCHDPADQGGDPEITQNGINYGPQGGDSRSFVLANHKAFGCGDCHNPHDLKPVDPVHTLACSGCHPTSSSQIGKVHINHL